MIDEKKVATMTKLAIMENREGADMVKTISYRKIDFVLTEIFRGAIAGTVCFLIGLVLWFFYLWDDLNDFIVGLDIMQLIGNIVLRYIIFMAAYLVICAIVAFRRHTRRMEQRYEYLSYLKELQYCYEYGREPRSKVPHDFDEDGGRHKRRSHRQEEA